jgi:DNA-binding GntR family transcriptional regulator
LAEAVERAYQAIRDGIMCGAYAQGAHITAQELAAAARLSRTPVREAMRRLHAEGLIQIIPNRGAFVARWSEVEVDQYFDVVVLLESHVAELATTQITDAQLAFLRDLADEMWALVRSDPPPIDKMKENNDLFHMTIIGACGNPRLRDLLRSMVEVEYVLGTFRRYNHDELVRSAHQHAELVSAFEARDPAWARSVMTTHLLSARHAMLRSLHNG